jgi:3-deoxy-D-manno-octulosonic-acid transferase
MSVSRSWALQGYLWLAKAMAPVWRWALQKRLQRGKETPESLAQKWVTDPPSRPQGPLVWGHAVGVGEAMALAGLFAQMGVHWPQAHFLITTTARTSGDALHKTGLPPRCIHQFAPVDTPATVARFLDHWQPALAVWCEMDLWPALIHATAQRGIAHALVNARLDAKALAKRRWGRLIYQALLPGFSTLWAQNTATRDGLITLGARPERVVVTGTIKSMSPPLACDAHQLQAWQQCLNSRPVWLLASSHPGEEALALQVHGLLRQQHPDALLVIAPRAPARGPEILALCPDGSLLRSASNALPTPSASVYVADTIGEMGLWFRLAPVAMLGGSWAPVGGHNPHEPLALGCRVLHGPHVWNFAESYSDLDGQGLSQMVSETTVMARAVSTAWAQPATPASVQPQAALGPLHSLIQLAQA